MAGAVSCLADPWLCKPQPPGRQRSPQAYCTFLQIDLQPLRLGQELLHALHPLLGCGSRGGAEETASTEQIAAKMSGCLVLRCYRPLAALDAREGMPSGSHSRKEEAPPLPTLTRGAHGLLHPRAPLVAAQQAQHLVGVLCREERKREERKGKGRGMECM